MEDRNRTRTSVLVQIASITGFSRTSSDLRPEHLAIVRGQLSVAQPMQRTRMLLEKACNQTHNRCDQSLAGLSTADDSDIWDHRGNICSL